MHEWEQVRKLLYLLARRFYNRYGADFCARRGVELADLEQEGYLAFLDALRAYDPAGPYQFNTYLTLACKARFRAAVGLCRRDPINTAASLSGPVSEDGEGELGELLPDPAASAELEAVDTDLERQSLRQTVEAALANLPPIQESALRRRYYQRQTIRAAAGELGISLSALRAEVDKGLRALRRDRRVRRLGTGYIEAHGRRHTSFSAWKSGGSVEEWLLERPPGRRYY